MSDAMANMSAVLACKNKINFFLSILCFRINNSKFKFEKKNK